jgi:hypothetical protein
MSAAADLLRCGQCGCRAGGIIEHGHKTCKTASVILPDWVVTSLASLTLFVSCVGVGVGCCSVRSWLESF